MMHGNLLFCEQYRAGVTPAGLAAAHAEWDRRHAAPLRAAWRPFEQRPQPASALAAGVRLVQLPATSGGIVHDTGY